MTNEEIVLQIQQGHTELYNDLWDGIHGIIAKMAFRYNDLYRDLCISSGITVDDLIQNGYIAMVDAAKDYKPEAVYKFSTYLNLHFKKYFAAMTGRRTSKQDVLAYCKSLDVPISEDSEITLLEVIPDSNNFVETSEEKIYQEQLHKTLDISLSELTDNQRTAIIGKYYNGLSLADIGRSQGISRERARQLEFKALQKMRMGKTRKRLEPFADEIMSRALLHTGLNSFLNLQASSVELTAEWLERKHIPPTVECQNNKKTVTPTIALCK